MLLSSTTMADKHHFSSNTSSRRFYLFYLPLGQGAWSPGYIFIFQGFFFTFSIFSNIPHFFIHKTVLISFYFKNVRLKRSEDWYFFIIGRCSLLLFYFSIYLIIANIPSLFLIIRCEKFGKELDTKIEILISLELNYKYLIFAWNVNDEQLMK